MDKLIIHTDGGARGNPGPAAIGFQIKTEKNRPLTELSRTIGVTTNNVAEYLAVIAALEWLQNHLTMKPFNHETIIQFYLDSILVVNQLNGKFKVKDPELRELLLKVRMLEAEIGGQIYYTSIPREKNFVADKLVNKALDGEKNV